MVGRTDRRDSRGWPHDRPTACVRGRHPTRRRPPGGGGAGGPGQGGPIGGAAFLPGGLGGPAGPSRPGGPPREPGRVPGPRAGPHPLRPDAGLAVHLLPRGRSHHGLGPVHHPPVGPERPGLRRCPPEQLRGVRLGRAEPGVRRQRLRRDPARTLGVGREAPGRQPGHRRPRPGVLRQGAGRRGPGGGLRLPDRDGQAGRPCGTSTSGTPAWTSRRSWTTSATNSDSTSPKSADKGMSKIKARADKAAGQGQDPGQHAGPREADRGGRR